MVNNNDKSMDLEEVIKQIPQIKKQRERFKEVFGEEVQKKIEKRAEKFKRSRATKRATRVTEKPVTFKSDLLKQSFRSQKELQEAETRFRQKREAQRIQKERAVARRERIERGKITGQVTGVRDDKRITLREKATTPFKVRGREVPVSRIVALENGRERPATKKEEEMFRERQLFVREAPQPKGRFAKVETGVRGLRQKALEETEVGKPTIKGQVLGVLSGVATSALGTVGFAKELVKDPIGTTRLAGRGIKETGRKLITGEGFPEIGRILKREPGFALGAVVGEVAQAKAGAIVGEEVGKVTTKVRTRVSPKFAPIKEVGEEFIVKVPGQFDDVDIVLKRGTSEVLEPITKQVQLAGQKVDAVSAAKDLFGEITKRRVKIKKEIPRGTPELEKAFFADPRSRLRTRRLGVTDKTTRATFEDLFAGDITFKKPKPQAIVFEKTPVARFPKRLSDIEKKLRTGKPLTAKQQQRFTEFQLKPTGQFKPVGFISPEAEITLAPGEIIRRKGKPAVTLIEGKRVEFVTAEVIKPTTRTQQLLKTSRDAGLGIKQTKELTKRLTKETGFDISRISRPSAEVVSLPSVGTGIGVQVGKRIRRPTKRVRDIGFELPIRPFQPSRVKPLQSISRRPIITRGRAEPRRVQPPTRAPSIIKPGISILRPSQVSRDVRRAPKLQPITRAPTRRIVGRFPLGQPKILLPPRPKKKKPVKKKKERKAQLITRFTPGFTAAALGLKGKRTRLEGALQLRLLPTNNKKVRKKRNTK